jgi:nucleotide-binding universal stress UspA family protein
MPATSPATSSDHAAPSLPGIGPVIVALGGHDSSGVLRAAHLFESTSVGGMLVVSVLESLTSQYGGDATSVPSLESEQERTDARRISLRKEIGDAPRGAAWPIEVLEGDPPYLIATLARARRAPLIVMGIGRRRPIDRLLGFDAATRTVRRASCPVLAVSATVTVPFHEAVVACDFSAASVSAAGAVVPLMGSGSVLHLVHVWDPRMVDDDRLEALKKAYIDSLPAKFARLEELLAAPADVTVKHEIREGKVAERLLDFADAHHADVIVAGRHGLGAMERLFVGSVTTTLIHGTHCSVLIAPEPALAERDRILRLMTRTSESHASSEWAPLLDGFTRRNRGRRTAVEIDDVSIGAQVLESGYPLQGAAYDHRDHRMELMLGDGATQHVTRIIAGVESIAFYADGQGRDAALMIAHGSGQTVLTFLPG